MTVESPPDVPEHVLRFLLGQTTMTIATATPSGVPHAASMIYVSDGATLYFCTRPDTTTASHIEQNPRVSLTIGTYSDDWRTMKGIQAAGEAYVLLSASAVAQVIALFREKFPAVDDVTTRNVSVFRITPTSLHYIDNEHGSQEQGIQTLAGDWRQTMIYTIFRELPSRRVEDVMGNLTHMTAEQGDVIVRQGAPADKFFIIADGEVEVLREDDGNTRTIATLTSGQFFGEMAVLRDLPRQATVRATRPTTLLAMPGDVFRGLVAQSLETTSDFDQLMQRRFSELDRPDGEG